MTALVFAWPSWWWVALLAPFLAAASCWLVRREEQRRERQLGRQLAAVAGRPRWTRTRAVADAAMWTGVAVALLGPVVPGDDGDAGAAVVVCVDVSWSMAARDETPSRLGAVQQALAELHGIDARSRLGLVAFAGQAERVAPLTADTAAVAALAADLVAGGVGTAGTDPGAAIDLARAMLQRAGAGGSILVLSDGEDFVGRGVAAAATASDAGIAVYAIGCGHEAGSKIPVANDGGEVFLRDAGGREIVSRRETAALQQLATRGGGRLLALAPGVLRSLHDDVLLPAAREQAVRAGQVVPVSLASWPLLLAMLFWMLRQCLPERSR